MNLYFAKIVNGYEKLRGMNDKIIDPHLIIKKTNALFFPRTASQFQEQERITKTP
jgi:hypothetical protein